jgi:hypothetical protein
VIPTVRFSIITVVLESIKAGSEELNSIKLFVIIKSKRMLNIRKNILIRIQCRYKSSLVFSKYCPQFIA